jgi:L-ascorbate metabolism protein UlaG (beta-lactamase superfamily)
VKWFLKRGVSLAVLSEAKTQAHHHEDLGCSILGPASRDVRRALKPLKVWAQDLEPNPSLKRAQSLIKNIEATAAYDALCTTRKNLGRRVLREAVIFPDIQKSPPRFLHVRNEAQGFDSRLGLTDWPALGDALSELSGGLSDKALQAFCGSRGIGEVFENLRSARWMEKRDVVSPQAPFTFVGHNTTAVKSAQARVVVDPYFRPASVFDLPSYQPMQAADVGRVDAIVITHSHGDHFHLGSLIQFPRQTKIFVPPVERESLFSTDCAARLRSLGFTQVEALPWWSSRQVKDIHITALPFFGEQPTDGPGVHSGLRNVGSTWLVKTPAKTALFVADAGHDVSGHMDQVMKKVQTMTHVDVLFSGVRGFKLKPIFFAHTTLESFLVDVPFEALLTPQCLMADATQAVNWAEILGATHLVPCADGGAPWYWREGMGPKYPGFPGETVPGASRLDENPDADPYPETAVQAALHSKVKVTVLRPGQQWMPGKSPVAAAPFGWPF